MKEEESPLLPQRDESRGRDKHLGDYSEEQGLVGHGAASRRVSFLPTVSVSAHRGQQMPKCETEVTFRLTERRLLYGPGLRRQRGPQSTPYH